MTLKVPCSPFEVKNHKNYHSITVNKCSYSFCLQLVQIVKTFANVERERHLGVRRISNKMNIGFIRWVEATTWWVIIIFLLHACLKYII